jgi:hypothetical protein
VAVTPWVELTQSPPQIVAEPTAEVKPTAPLGDVGVSAPSLTVAVQLAPAPSSRLVGVQARVVVVLCGETVGWVAFASLWLWRSSPK